MNARQDGHWRTPQFVYAGHKLVNASRIFFVCSVLFGRTNPYNTQESNANPSCEQTESFAVRYTDEFLFVEHIALSIAQLVVMYKLGIQSKRFVVFHILLDFVTIHVIPIVCILRDYNNTHSDRKPYMNMNLHQIRLMVMAMVVWFSFESVAIRLEWIHKHDDKHGNLTHVACWKILDIFTSIPNILIACGVLSIIYGIIVSFLCMLLNYVMVYLHVEMLNKKESVRMEVGVTEFTESGTQTTQQPQDE